MKITGRFSVKAPRTAVFDAMSDPQFFISCIDGVSDFNEIDDTHYSAVLETKVAYIKFRFNVEVEVVRMEAPALIEARVTGAPIGIVGRFTSSSITELHEEGDETIIAYEIDASLAGKLGSIGQPVVKSKARDMEAEFTRRLRASFALADAVS